MGLTTISLAPLMIPEVKKIVRLVSLDQCQKITRKALSFDTSKQVINYLRDEITKLINVEL